MLMKCTELYLDEYRSDPDDLGTVEKLTTMPGFVGIRSIFVETRPDEVGASIPKNIGFEISRRKGSAIA